MPRDIVGLSIGGSDEKARPGFDLAVPLNAPTAVNADFLPGHLPDIRQIKILIEQLPKGALGIGLTREALSNLVLDHLNRDVPKLKINDDAPTALYVCITSTQDGGAVDVRVAVFRPGQVTGDTHTKIFIGAAIVWMKETLLTGSADVVAPNVKNSIEESVAEFVSQYHKENFGR